MDRVNALVLPVALALFAVTLADILAPPRDSEVLDHLVTDLLALACGVALGVGAALLTHGGGDSG